uniref:Uncharacterized protein n=1 Tax=Methylophaga nitratireducenticrescens TaxID=754476 RepID=I1XGG1_METNJ
MAFCLPNSIYRSVSHIVGNSIYLYGFTFNVKLAEFTAP